MRGFFSRFACYYYISCLLGCWLAMVSPAWGATVTQLSFTRGATYPASSANGLFVAFVSTDNSLVPGGAGTQSHIYAINLQTEERGRVSIAADGTAGNGPSYFPSISEDGRFIAFQSVASNLVPSDTNASADNPISGYDIFVRDLVAQTTTRVSISSDGKQANNGSFSPSISLDGRYVAFTSLADNLVPNGKAGVYLHDCEKRQTTYIASGGFPAVSGDGRFLAFFSEADNLVPNDTNGVGDIFLYDNQTREIKRISTAANGTPGNAASKAPIVISEDGRYIAFTSDAGNLVPGDTNGRTDVFIRDMEANAIARASVAANGTQGNYDSGSCGDLPLGMAISADGSTLVFGSLAGTLIPGDTNNARDVFLYDIPSRKLSAVNINKDGTPASSMSGNPAVNANGQYVFFTTETVPTQAQMAQGTQAPPTLNVLDRGDRPYLQKSRKNSAISLMSLTANRRRGNGSSSFPSMSADGRFLAFATVATNLAPGDTNKKADIIVRDTQGNVQATVSVGVGGKPANADSGHRGLSISGNGKFVAYTSSAINLVPGDLNSEVDIFIADMQTGQTTLASTGYRGESNGESSQPVFNESGRYLAFTSTADSLVPNDKNVSADVFLRDLESGKTLRVSIGLKGAGANGASTAPAINASGRCIAFASLAGNLVDGDNNGKSDVFVHDLDAKEMTCVSVAGDGAQGNGDSAQPAISADGRYVVFSSIATNLVAGDTNGQPDIFLYDRQEKTTTRINVSSDGTQSDGLSGFSSISGDGRYITYVSTATNLAPNLSGAKPRLFLYDRQAAKTTCLSLDIDGKPTTVEATPAGISADGQYIVFASSARNLLPEGSNGFVQLYRYDRGKDKK
ncbi:MAG: TolB family protein [Armatimonadota bacterium]